jgi:hypothetical protein
VVGGRAEAPALRTSAAVLASTPQARVARVAVALLRWRGPLQPACRHRNLVAPLPSPARHQRLSSPRCPSASPTRCATTCCTTARSLTRATTCQTGMRPAQSNGLASRRRCGWGPASPGQKHVMPCAGRPHSPVHSAACDLSPRPRSARGTRRQSNPPPPTTHPSPRPTPLSSPLPGQPPRCVRPMPRSRPSWAAPRHPMPAPPRPP